MTVNWLGLLSIGVFYIIVLGTGIWASRKSKQEEKKSAGRPSEVAMVGGRNLHILVSVCTMTATWVGGGYILGTAEVVYDPTKGLVWAFGPISYTLNLIIGGLFFTTPMRKKNYVTLMDPFQVKYGNTAVAVLFIPVIISDIFWVACILGALGGTLTVVMDIPSPVAVCISAAVAILYTVMGGLYSVAYTDVIQLSFMFLGLWICVPFILTSPSATNITTTAVNKLYQDPWIGKLELEDAGYWIDNLLLLIICILYLSQWVNVYGACSGFVFSLLLRGLVGEPPVGLPDVLPLPWDRIQEDGHRYRLFPFRTAIVILTFAVILLVSKISIWLKGKKLLTSGEEMNEMHDLGPNQKNVEENEALNKDEEPSYPA